MQGWQIELAVAGGIFLLLLLAILFGTASVRISYRNGLIVRVYVFGFYKTVFGGSPAKKPLKDLAHAPSPDRLLKKEQKRLWQLEKKAEKKRKKAAKKAQKSAKPSADEPAPNLKENLDMILAILKRAYSLTKGNIRLDFRKLHLRVATGDAASTAIFYGVIVQNAALLLQWINDHFNKIHRRKGDMTIEPDYLSGKPSLEVDLRMRVRLLRAAGIGIGLYRTYTAEKKRAKRRAKRRVALKEKKLNLKNKTQST